MVTDRDAGPTSSYSDFSFRAPPVPAPGGIASSRSVVPEAQPACRLSHQNTSLSLLRRCGARGRAPSRSRPSPLLYLISTPMRGRPGLPPVPALGGIASSRSVVHEAQRVCPSSHQNTSLSLARLCGARGRTPSR